MVGSLSPVNCRAVVPMMSSEPQNIVTKLGMVMQQNESECHVEQKLFAVFKVKVTARALMIKI